LLLAMTLSYTRAAGQTICPGDCNGNGTVTVDEIILMVNVALGGADVSTCEAGDVNRDGQITVDEIIAAVNGALNACPTAAIPTNTPTAPATLPPASTATPTAKSSAVVLKGALKPTVGRFNYNLMLGIPGANAACDMNFAGTHVCSYSDLQMAETAGDLVGLKDTGNNAVTSFWAIDSTAPPLSQCNDDIVGGSGLNWEYGTAHTLSRGQKVPLTNSTGALGSLQTGVQCNISGASSLGCCQ
jgi:hypothetical protein